MLNRIFTNLVYQMNTYRSGMTQTAKERCKLYDSRQELSLEMHQDELTSFNAKFFDYSESM